MKFTNLYELYIYILMSFYTSLYHIETYAWVHYRTNIIRTYVYEQFPLATSSPHPIITCLSDGLD